LVGNCVLTAQRDVCARGVGQMSNVVDFQYDAMECLRMAERAKAPQEKSMLVGLAQAWVLLGEQFGRLPDENARELSKPGEIKSTLSTTKSGPTDR
jgi:hypothetical protein